MEIISHRHYGLYRDNGSLLLWNINGPELDQIRKQPMHRGSLPKMFVGKGVLKICRKFKG